MMNCVLFVSALSLNWLMYPAVEVVTENQSLRCGSHCLYVALSMFGKAPETIEELESRMGRRTAKGYSVRQLMAAAEHYGASVAAVETNMTNVVARQSRFACIALLTNQHFVLIGDIRDGRAMLVDPPRTYSIPVETLGSQWSGAALLISDVPLESEEGLVWELRQSAILSTFFKFVFALAVVGLSFRILRKRIVAGRSE
jgi:ABC-type bacteriocin/lantibiotic exporter with double-glycine peptidase domain